MDKLTLRDVIALQPALAKLKRDHLKDNRTAVAVAKNIREATLHLDAWNVTRLELARKHSRAVKNNSTPVSADGAGAAIQSDEAEGGDAAEKTAVKLPNGEYDIVDQAAFMRAINAEWSNEVDGEFHPIQYGGLKLEKIEPDVLSGLGPILDGEIP